MDDDDLTPEDIADVLEIVAQIEAGELETVVLDLNDDGSPSLEVTPEVMDQFLEDPDEAAEVIAQVKDFLRQLPPDEDATMT